jgi:predicted HTH transcriptional regulator
MEPFPDVRGLEIFPALESKTLEFKESFSQSIRPRITATICSFLNAKGGYIVCGVEDKERRIVGLNAPSAILDANVRWFDEFYHGKRITDSDGNPLTVGELEARLVEVVPEKYILVVTVIPTPGKTYKTRDGSLFFRLGASVYKYQESSSLDSIQKELGDKLRDANRRIELAAKETLAARQEAKAAKEDAKAARMDLEAAHQKANIAGTAADLAQTKMGEYRHELYIVRKDLKEIIGAAKGVEERLDLYVAAMEKEILEKKAAAEETLQRERSWWKCWQC